MSTLKDFRDSYYELSGTASEVSRQLGFAGIAVIWIFKADLPEKAFALAPELYHAGTFIILSLAFDLLQYLFGSLIWGAYWRYKESRGATDKTQIEAPPYFNWPAIVCFWAKLALMVVAYCFLLKFLLGHISPAP
ncbi:MAG TPA: hypothetical protein VN283_11480 [Thiobacillus sp.]|nr:hypothetical protein [Thiobacillus sp.]